MKKWLAIGMACMMALFSVTGCSKDNAAGTTESESAVENVTVAPAGTQEASVDPDEIALVVGDTLEVPAYELFFYYAYVKEYYESSGYVTDWNVMADEQYTMATMLKKMVEEQVIQINYFYKDAVERKLELTEDEIKQTEEEAESLMNLINKDAQERYGITTERVAEFAKHQLLANKAYEAMGETQEAALTAEDKEHTTYRHIQHILISTMEGPQAQTSESDSETSEEDLVKAQAEYEEQQKALAGDVLAKVNAGEDFVTLANEYTADGGVDYYINDLGQTLDGATMVTEFTEAAVALNDGEVSGLVKTDYGYHIIKCITTNDEATSKEALVSKALGKLNTIYQTWFESKDYELKPVWTDYVVVNPVIEGAEESSEETEAVETPESIAETQAE